MVCRIPHPYGSINLPNIPISGAQDTVFTVLCHRASNPPYQLDSHHIPLRLITQLFPKIVSVGSVRQSWLST